MTYQHAIYMPISWFTHTGVLVTVCVLDHIHKHHSLQDILSTHHGIYTVHTCQFCNRRISTSPMCASVSVTACSVVCLCVSDCLCLSALCLSVCLHLPVLCLPVYLSVSVCLYEVVCLSVCVCLLCVCLYLPGCVSVCVFVCLPTLNVRTG